MPPNSRLLIALASISLLALEMVWTRIFSAEFFYTFAFLILSLAILGLGLGALAHRMWGVLRSSRALGMSLSLAGLAALAGPPLAFQLGVDFQLLFGSWSMVGKVALLILLLGSAFFFGGIAIAWLLSRNSERIGQVYAADLLGAGVGVLAAIWAMNSFGTPAAVFASALPILLAAVLASPRAWKILPLLAIAVAGYLVPRAPGLLHVEREERAPVVYEHWDAMAKIKMYSFGGAYRGLNVDNVANTPVVPFDGDWDKWYEDPSNSEWDINVGYLMGLFEEPTFLSLGSGGGMDVMQALDHGAKEVHAVEVNPHINKMLLEGDPDGYVQGDSSVIDSTGALVLLPEFSGRLYHDPRVTVVSEDARAYVRRFEDKFDIIYSLSSNTWAALGSGAFALTENYLFTQEAFEDYWRALTEDGFLSMEHQVYMPRLVSEVIAALENLGVENPRDHFAVYDLPRMRRNLLLLSKRPLTEDLRYRAYGELTPEFQQHIQPLYPAPDSLEANLVNQIVLNGWEAMADSTDINLSPCTDDRPFIAQMGTWRGLHTGDLESVSRYAEFSGFPMSKLIIVIILGIVSFLIIPLNALPYLGGGNRLRLVPWAYFMLIGMAFMSLEVILIQKYTLFIGASVYSIATVLLTLLLASGVGSLYSDRVSARGAFLGILIWLAVDWLLLGAVTRALSFLPISMRALATALLIAPLGFCMGMPFPKAGRRVGELVDWGFAVNGAASVLGATLIVVVGFEFGFSVALVLGALLYLGAFGLFSARAQW